MIELPPPSLLSGGPGDGRPAILAPGQPKKVPPNPRYRFELLTRNERT
ncbi:hypothetical protein THTE_3129 [Thermogutta terrifontis]|uniref:Uncharacterized protein n=1 Tax=Thermogutta terrifontis TaxID=1331910 RepID=A0A286RIE4_9BACT|nr:hypothetical protein THTE_3129 [Thermogutta terrifontis]